MRKYFIFNIKDEILNLYEDSPLTLYNVLKKIYKMRKDEINYGFNLFKQITNKIDKETLDRQIFLALHNKMIYSKNDNEHIINNLYKDEIGVLKVNKSHMYLEVNNNYSYFFNVLNDLSTNYFVCDFENQDYFFLSKIKILV